MFKREKCLTTSEEDLMEIFWKRTFDKCWNFKYISWPFLEWELCIHDVAIIIKERDDKGLYFITIWNAVCKTVCSNHYQNYINVPMEVGIFRKSILLPDEPYTDSELYYILKHEYTHFQNKDLLIKILIYIYWCLFWWNPAIYLLKNDLSQILEIKCDLDVIDHMGNEHRVEYLTTIVTMLKNASANSIVSTFCGTTALISKKYELQIYWKI